MRSRQSIRAIAFACFLAAAPSMTRGQDAPSPIDKSGFTLINPTPKSAMRDFVTDRPNVTEAPFSVDAGHVQIETSFVEYTYDHGDRSDGFSVAPTNFRLGVTNNVDVQLIVNPYQNIHSHGHGESARNAGFGDVTLRSTVNLWGNDGGNSALGLIPFISFPTGTDGLSDHHIEGGLIVPLDVQLPHGFDLGTEVEFDVNHNDARDEYGVDFVHTVCLGHSLFCEKLAGYAEYVGVSPCGTGHTYLAYFDTGVTYALTENIQLDLGINIGLADRADDFTVFSGLSIRL